MEKNSTTSAESNLSEDEKKTLHKIALTAIKKRLEKEPPSKPESTTNTLKEKRGAFVSLHKHGQLRGCIGYVPWSLNL